MPNFKDRFTPVGDANISLTDTSQPFTGNIPPAADGALFCAVGGNAIFRVTGDAATSSHGIPLANGQVFTVPNIEWIRNLQVIASGDPGGSFYILFVENINV